MKIRLCEERKPDHAAIQHLVLSCSHCQMKKSPKQRQTAPGLPIGVEGPFHRVAVDCLGSFPVTNSGNRYIVVFSNYLTRFPGAFAVPTIDAATFADLLVNEIIARHGAPPTLLSDRGSNFLSSLVKEVCYLMDTKKVFTTFYHPQYVMGLWRDLTALSPRAFQCASAVTRKIGTNS